MTRVRPLIPVIIGPTAGGKTALAVACAQKLTAATGCPAHIISADSVQIYRGMDIGSAKPTAAERQGIPHHLIDILDPDDAFTVHDWLAKADNLIEELQRVGICPVLVGGTHLYIKALVDGLFQGPTPDPALREELSIRPLSTLRHTLEQVDPESAARIHPADQRRTVRALEVYIQSGVPISILRQQWDRQHPRRDDLLLLGLDWPTDQINSRINLRAKEMMGLGFLDEVRELLPCMGVQARQAIGYAQLAAHLRGESTLEDALEQIKVETRRFAKNQRTWLKRLSANSSFRWVPGASVESEGTAQDISRQCLAT